MEFSLLKLPSLAQDEVFKSLDPLGIISLSWKSKKLDARLSRLFKGLKFSLKIHRGYTLSFNFLEKSIEAHEVYPQYSEDFSELVKTNGYEVIQVLHKVWWKRLTKAFDHPKTIVVHSLNYGDSSYEVSRFGDPDSYDFRFHQIIPARYRGKHTMTNCKKTAKQALEEFKMREDYRGISLELKNADWMTLDDFMIVLNIDSVVIHNFKDSSQGFARFLEKWIQKGGWLRDVKLKIPEDSDCDCKVELDELEGVSISSGYNGTYRIKSANASVVGFYGDKTFHFWRS